LKLKKKSGKRSTARYLSSTKVSGETKEVQYG
jgi:hypothetical protein